MDKHCSLAGSFCTICITCLRQVSPGNIRLRYEGLKSHLTLKAKSLTRARASECSNGGATDAGQPGRNWLVLRLGMAEDGQTDKPRSRHRAWARRRACWQSAHIIHADLRARSFGHLPRCRRAREGNGNGSFRESACASRDAAAVVGRHSERRDCRLPPPPPS